MTFPSGKSSKAAAAESPSTSLTRECGTERKPKSLFSHIDPEGDEVQILLSLSGPAQWLPQDPSDLSLDAGRPAGRLGSQGHSCEPTASAQQLSQSFSQAHPLPPCHPQTPAPPRPHASCSAALVLANGAGAPCTQVSHSSLDVFI